MIISVVRKDNEEKRRWEESEWNEKYEGVCFAGKSHLSCHEILRRVKRGESEREGERDE